jgi:hypothetical protein
MDNVLMALIDVAAFLAFGIAAAGEGHFGSGVVHPGTSKQSIGGCQKE